MVQGPEVCEYVCSLMSMAVVAAGWLDNMDQCTSLTVSSRARLIRRLGFARSRNETRGLPTSILCEASIYIC